MNRLINVLVLLAAILLVGGMGIGYGFIWRVFPAGTFWKFSIACLLFAMTLILVQIREKK